MGIIKKGVRIRSHLTIFFDLIKTKVSKGLKNKGVKINKGDKLI